jgi:hypothetical protein
MKITRQGLAQTLLLGLFAFLCDLGEPFARLAIKSFLKSSAAWSQPRLAVEFRFRRRGVG